MATGVGGGIGFFGQHTVAGGSAEYGTIAGVKENATPADYKGNLVFAVGTNPNGITTEVGRFTSTGLAVTGALSCTTGANFATSSGNVGIGTSSPSSRLAVSGGDATAVTVDYNAGISTGAEYSALRFTASALGFVPAEIRAVNTNGGQNLGVMQLFTSATERARIDSSGNVGIGTTSPGSKLDVNGEIRIGNTVNTVTATLPNRTITMVIGGTTYYIHAKTTND